MSFLKQLQIFVFILSSTLLFSQKTNFTTDNGFSGTFELVNSNQVKQGSIVVNKFKTSVGEFSGTDLQEEGVVFPWSCLDCAFEIANMGNPVQVKNTTGRGFAHIIKAAKNHVKEQQEDKLISEIIKEIKEKNTLNDQRKLAYNTYQLVSNTTKVDKLVSEVENGMFLPNSNVTVITNTKIPSKKDIKTEPDTVNSKISVIEIKNKEQEQIKETTVENIKETKVSNHIDSINNSDENEHQDQSKYKSAKCEKTIQKLEQRLASAKATNDNLIVNEVNRALEKQYKKCL